MSIKRILFVCLGNICRSPAGEQILRQMAEGRGVDLHIESCGTGDWHIGQGAHPPMIEAAKKRGFHLNGTARQFRQEDFENFDLILAADKSVCSDLEKLSTAADGREKIRLMTHFSKEFAGGDVPDPYFGGSEGYDLALDMLEQICQDILDEVN